MRQDFPLGQRILIVGRGGSGKSTLARRLGDRFGLPVIHLDRYYFQPGWIPIEGAAFEQAVASLVAKDRWVIEGNYSGTMALRAARADTAIFLQRSRILCVLSVIARAWKGRGTVRADAAPGCEERFDWRFYLFVWNWRPTKIMLALQSFEGRRIALNGRAALTAFLAQLEGAGSRPQRSL